jgi:hypothetical protein
LLIAPRQDAGNVAILAVKRDDLGRRRHRGVVFAAFAAFRRLGHLSASFR